MTSLIWKEWHEQSWKLAFGCLVLGALALIGLHARIIADETMVMWVCFIGIGLLPVLSSTGLIPAERADGTFESLLAIPISPGRILLVKTAMGLLLCAGPMIIAAAVSLLSAGGREMSSQAMLILYTRSALAALAMFVWMMALTVHLPNEARAGLLALGLLVFWLLATAGLAYPPVPELLFAFSPLSFVFGIAAEKTNAPPLSGIIAIQIATSVALWFWTSRRLTAHVEETS
jgi:ABC-type transport system involved in multi-copper enzyme maturation permease subunit